MAARRAHKPSPEELDDLRSRLRTAGLRATPARVAVYGALRRTGRPLSHADVCREVGADEFDRATIYRNLLDLTEAGLARRADLGDHVWRFEGGLDGAPDIAAHPHFVCSECGTVTCLPEDAVQVAGVASLPKSVRGGAADLEIQIRGTCDDCD